ncbi:MAG: hypothetical protein ABII20_00100 [Candidatus Omnitrophota bacterium]|nr:hypothetical protein [Candidatus Omnitrophota bacterium]MBU2528757.1 hypothetical protein [bacterium]MBU3929129.1 hypothetical protein [bacterium]MBU4122352.1 hypothetical protein [bacterium]
MDSKQIKRDIEDKIMEWQKQLDEKDSKINTFIEENALLKTEISRKLIMSPALKERLMGDVGRLLANMKNDLRKSAVKERDLSSRLESARAKIDSLSAEIAAQNSMIEKLKADIAVASKNADAAALVSGAEHEKEKTEELKRLTLEFEKKLQEQAAEASMQIDALMREISERE